MNTKTKYIRIRAMLCITVALCLSSCERSQEDAKLEGRWATSKPSFSYKDYSDVEGAWSDKDILEVTYNFTSAKNVTLSIKADKPGPTTIRTLYSIDGDNLSIDASRRATGTNNFPALKCKYKIVGGTLILTKTSGEEELLNKTK